MSGFNIGDLIEARSDTGTVIVGRIAAKTSFNGGWLVFDGISASLDPHKWKATLIESAPEPLPTGPNSVVRFECDEDRRHVLAWRSLDGTWDLLDSRGYAHVAVTDPYAWLKEQGLKLERVTRLVPEVAS